MSRKSEHSPALRGRAPAAGADIAAGSMWVAVFVIALLVPIQIYIGSIRLSFYRVALFLVIVPIVIRLASTAPVRLRLADILIVIFALTAAFSLIMTDASAAAVGIFIVESVGPYFLARTFIRNSRQFSAMVRTLATCIIVTIPFALYENLTANPILLTVLGKFLPVLPNVPHEQRLGLDRAQVTFDHPILYGVFCAFGFALAIYAVRPGPPPRLSVLRGTFVGLAAFLSLSSGALVAVGLQGALILYDRLLRGFRQRWTLLVSGSVILYVLAEVFSNRSVPQILVPYLALNAGTGYTRLIVNDWAISGIMAHPWFGFGFTLSWPVPFWVVTTSIDNFWLAMAFRHGLPTMIFLLAAVGFMLLSVIRTRQTDPFVNACRTGFVITVIAICLAIISVHLWNSTYCAFMFLLGAGMWMTEAQVEPQDTTVEPGPATGQRQETRFRRNLPPVYRR